MENDWIVNARLRYDVVPECGVLRTVCKVIRYMQSKELEHLTVDWRAGEFVIGLV